MSQLFLFDMDGTLINSNSIWKDVDIEFLRRRGMKYTKAYYEGVAHTIFPLASTPKCPSSPGSGPICASARRKVGVWRW